MLRARHAQRGMTLIEFAIGLVLIALLITLAAPSFSLWIANSRIRTAAEAVQNGLQLARAEAVRRNTAIRFSLTSVGGGGTGSDWTVGCVNTVIDSDGDGVDECPAAIQTRPGNEGSTGIVVAVAAGQDQIVFNGIGRMTQPTGVAGVGINLSNPAGGTCVADGGDRRCLRIQVSLGGQIRLCDPAKAATDPQGCLP